VDGGRRFSDKRSEGRGIDVFDVAFPLPQHFHFGRIDVEAGHGKAGFAKFDHQRKTDIAKTDNRYLGLFFNDLINK